METIALTIDGKKISSHTGTSIFEAARQSGIIIPNLCYHPELKPFGACRMCLVEDENTGRLMASCVTPVEPDMVVQTASKRVVKHRQNIVRLMIAEHPESCIVCSKGNRCRLRWIAAQLGIGETNLYHMPNYKPYEEANPFIIRDLSKCILCGKCIRADHELVVVGAIDYSHRGFQSRPATVHETGLEGSSCTFCGTCVSMCPTGALSTKNTYYVGTPEHETNSICGFCSVGCSLAVGTSSEKVIEVNPAHLPGSVNGATLCVRGHFAHDFLNSRQRLITPLIRKNETQGQNGLVPVEWGEALELVANRLIHIRTKYGPQSIAFLGSTKCTNEENYLFQKLARASIGTNNVDNGGYCSGQKNTHVIFDNMGGAYRTSRIADLENAEAIVVLGADPCHSVPVFSYYLKRAAKQGTPLIVVDPRHTELVDFASMWLRPKLNTDLELINALAAVLHDEKWHDLAYIDKFTKGFRDFRKSLKMLDLGRVSRLTGIDRNGLTEVVESLKDKKIVFVVGRGILLQKNAMQIVGAIYNLSLLTGSIGVKGGGVYFLAKENNQIGAFDMGTFPDMLPGRQTLGDENNRKNWERKWNVSLSRNPGLNMVRMVEAAERGKLKALYVMGENILRSLPQTERVRQALSKVDFLVVQDILYNETTQLAHVVLPGAAFSEKQGSFTNLEGRIQPFDPVTRPPGKAKPDWEIIDILQAKLEQTEAYGDLEKIRMEIRQHVPAYASLNGKRQTWIQERSEMDFSNGADSEGSVKFIPVASIKPESNDSDYPMSAIIGSMRYHLGSGTRSAVSKRIQGVDQEGRLEISYQDSITLKVKDGDKVTVTSRCGSLTRGVRIGKSLSAGHIFVPLGFNGNDAMNLLALSDYTEPDTPGWNTCRVKVKRV
ncbi:MAG: molybdopterin-dependent oxidoreductase [Deltaproteobacteria bacterium]|nr:molybdopterin-dependent oxidoreductase [Deltaproteobacteria bacterium]